jgi:hypothetical protein
MGVTGAHVGRHGADRAEGTVAGALGCGAVGDLDVLRGGGHVDLGR